MAVSKSWETKIALSTAHATPRLPPQRRLEFWLLCITSILVASALFAAWQAKTRNLLSDEVKLSRGELLNINQPATEDELKPFLRMLPEDARDNAAAKLHEYLAHARPVPNIGVLARLRENQQRLLPLTKLKPLLVVRTPREFTTLYLRWTATYFAAFFLVHLLWRWRRFAGDGTILPVIQLLTGFGLTLAVSLRDPLRDTLEFGKFSWGVAAGCALLLLPLLKPFSPRVFSQWIYSPLLAAIALFGLLLRFGSGPTGSDSKVNLGPFQPVELIKVLLVLFLAGYFARRWEWLRELRETRLLPGVLRKLDMPRFAQALPVMLGASSALVLFFVLKDMGPALVIGFLFLVMFAVARGRAGLAVFGILVLVGGVTAGFKLGTPHTVVGRISMWLTPWDNDVHGGDQLAHSLWAFATGGPFGSGPGLGDPGMIPAGHTDLVLSAIGEEWGFAGVACIFLLFAFLFWRAMRAALRADDDYSMFLALGLGSLLTLEMLLISGGVLGVIPLSGVVSPFLSSGNTAMLVNFLIVAMIAAVSSRTNHDAMGTAFRRPIRWLSAITGLAALTLFAKAASIQVINDGELIARDSRVIEEDGVKRAQRNPRLNSLARDLVRGNIYDRNGVLLATSNWSELEQRRAQYEQLGVEIAKACSRMDNRHYPFGPATVHLIGDLRTGERFHATNASLIEHDENARLQGFSDYSELAALVRHRHQQNYAPLEALRARDRSIRTSIDIRLQLRAEEILARRLQATNRTSGALVVMDPQTGDLLALASAGDSLDRARYGQYPPGSTFKLVTAIAALRLDPELRRKKYRCQSLGGGRVGANIAGWNRPIRDDAGDAAHGSVDMEKGIQVSCNAYFAQLGVNSVGSKALLETAALLDIPAGDIGEVRKMLPFAAYGQGPVLISPFKMARVAAAIAAGGALPQGRWITGDVNRRTEQPKRILDEEMAQVIARAMRAVVTGGTGNRAMQGLDIAVAGKTGTAQVEEGAPHSWFAGFAPYDAPPANRIAFAVVVEHGGYGSLAAAPVAREVIEAARDLGIIHKQEKQ